MAGRGNGSYKDEISTFRLSLPTPVVPVTAAIQGGALSPVNPYSTEAADVFRRQSLDVRECTENDARRAIELWKTLRAPPILAHHENLCLLLECYVTVGDEDRSAQLAGICAATHNHMNAMKSLVYVVLHGTLPSPKQTALLAALRAQFAAMQVPGQSRTDAGRAAIRKHLTASAIAVARFPKSKAVHLQVMTMTVAPIPPTPPPTHSLEEFWAPWYTTAGLPDGLRRLTDAALRRGADLYRKISIKLETGIPDSRFDGQRPTVVMEGASVPLFHGQTRRRMENVQQWATCGGGRRIANAGAVSVDQALIGLAMFLDAYLTLDRASDPVIDADADCLDVVVDHLGRLKTGIQYVVAILTCPARCANTVVAHTSGSGTDHAHSVAGPAQEFVESWRAVYTTATETGVMKPGDMESVMHTRLVQALSTGDGLLCNVLNAAHPFYRDTESLAWGVVMAHAKTHTHRLHVLTVLEARLAGMVGVDDFGVDLLGVIAFLSNPAWHKATARETLGFERGVVDAAGEVVVPSGSHNSEANADGDDSVDSVATRPLVEEVVTDIVVRGGDDDAGTTALTVFDRTLGPEMGAVCLASRDDRDGFVGGYVDLLSSWVTEPRTLPVGLLGRPFRAAVEELASAPLPKTGNYSEAYLMDLRSPSLLHYLVSRGWPQGRHPFVGPRLLAINLSDAGAPIDTLWDRSITEPTLQLCFHKALAVLFDSLRLHSKTADQITLADIAALVAFDPRRALHNIGLRVGAGLDGDPLVWHGPPDLSATRSPEMLATDRGVYFPPAARHLRTYRATGGYTTDTKDVEAHVDAHVAPKPSNVDMPLPKASPGSGLGWSNPSPSTWGRLSIPEDQGWLFGDNVPPADWETMDKMYDDHARVPYLPETRHLPVGGVIGRPVYLHAAEPSESGAGAGVGAGAYTRAKPSGALALVSGAVDDDSDDDVDPSATPQTATTCQIINLDGGDVHCTKAFPAAPSRTAQTIRLFTVPATSLAPFPLVAPTSGFVRYKLSIVWLQAVPFGPDDPAARLWALAATTAWGHCSVFLATSTGATSVSLGVQIPRSGVNWLKKLTSVARLPHPFHPRKRRGVIGRASVVSRYSLFRAAFGWLFVARMTGHTVPHGAMTWFDGAVVPVEWRLDRIPDVTLRTDEPQSLVDLMFGNTPPPDLSLETIRDLEDMLGRHGDGSPYPDTGVFGNQLVRELQTAIGRWGLGDMLDPRFADQYEALTRPSDDDTDSILSFFG